MKDSTHTHPLDVGRLTVGLVFLGMVAVWLVIQVTGVDLGNAQWLFPVTLILAGIVGLAASGARGLVRSRSRRSAGDEDTTYVDHHDDPPYYDLTSDLSEQLTRAEQEQRASRARAPHADDTTDTPDTGTTDTDTSGEQR